MAMRRPAEVFRPGEFLRDELEERGWTEADLAEILGQPVSMVKEIVSGTLGISSETAYGLSAAFGTSPEFWMNLDTAYQLARVRNVDSEAIAHRAKLHERSPVKDLIKR